MHYSKYSCGISMSANIVIYHRRLVGPREPKLVWDPLSRSAQVLFRGFSKAVAVKAPIQPQKAEVNLGSAVPKPMERPTLDPGGFRKPVAVPPRSKSGALHEAG